MVVKELFKNFLQEKGAFEQFCENLENESVGCGLTFDDFLKKQTSQFDTLIQRAFYWIDTEQGCLYWGALNTEWKHLLRANMANL